MDFGEKVNNRPYQRYQNVYSLCFPLQYQQSILVLSANLSMVYEKWPNVYRLLQRIKLY